MSEKPEVSTRVINGVATALVIAVALAMLFVMLLGAIWLTRAVF